MVSGIHGIGEQVTVLTDWIQMGFAGLSLLLLLLLLWVLRQSAKERRESRAERKETNAVLLALNTSIVQNTEVTRAVGTEIRTLGESVGILTRTVLRQNGGTGDQAGEAYVTQKRMGG